MTGSRSTTERPVFWIAGLLFFLLLILGFAFGFPGKAAASPIPEPQLPQQDDAACLSCHGESDLRLTLPSGEVLYATISPAIYEASVHAQAEEGVTCTSCHTNITGYPHPPLEAQDLRDLAIQYSAQCQECHEDKFVQGGDNVHFAALEAGNKNAAVCSDCHEPHSQPRITDPTTGVILPEMRVRIPHTCARCHSSIFEEYENSVHGDTLLSEGNLDVPTCTECHGAHQIADPGTPEFRIESPLLCARCHTDPVAMAKYGLSTQVLDTYVSDFHGTTVALFQKTQPDQPTNSPVCYDCHGVHGIARVDDPERGLEIKQNLLITCQRCHPDATLNFPDSWMSHYIASPTRHPLVFFVDLFYIILIPTILGGMVLYVATDIFRRTKDRRKGETHS